MLYRIPKYARPSSLVSRTTLPVMFVEAVAEFALRPKPLVRRYSPGLLAEVPEATGAYG
jgi:hypothetical protein